VEHIALPGLYGAPAYARPPAPMTPTELPPDPDDLPIAAYQTPEEREIAEQLMASPYLVAERRQPAEPTPQLRPQPFILGALADRILRRAS
jgi:hypothetical protein